VLLDYAEVEGDPGRAHYTILNSSYGREWGNGGRAAVTETVGQVDSLELG
jgi:hypothetical protein